MITQILIAEDYEESLKNQLSKCSTDDTGDITDKNKACEFPFRNDGILHNECIVDTFDYDVVTITKIKFSLLLTTVM